MNNGTLNFRLKSIKELLFEQSKVECDVDTITFSFYTQTYINVQNEEVKVKGGVMYKCVGEEVVKLEMLIIFVVESLKDIVTTDEESQEVKLKVDIIPTFISSAIGIIRGVVFEKTRENVFSKIPFPLIPMDNLVKDNLIFME